MRAGKILGFLVGGLFVLFAVVLLSVRLFVDPNHYKEEIAAAVKHETGRDLVLQGNIRLSVFPWVALELGPASLGSPAGFAEQPFVAFRHAAVRARLLPLLRQRLEIARVEIDGLDLRLLENAEGKGNWAGFGRPEAPTPGDGSGTAAPGAVTTASADAHSPLSGLAGIKITDARVSYQNYVLENLNLETAPFTDGVVPVSLHFVAHRGVASESAAVEAKVDFSTPAPRHYRLAALSLNGQVSLAHNNRPVKWNVSTPGLDVDLGAQTLALPGLAVNVAGAQLTAEVKGTRIVDDPAITGSLTLAPLVVREFMPRLNLSAPATQDPHALSQVSGSLAFAYGAKAMRVDTLHLALDDTQLQGSVAVNLETSAVSFDLSGDKINLDRYLPPPGQTPAPAPAAVTFAPANAAEGEPSKPLDAQGTLSFGALQVARLDLTQLKVTLTAKAGVTHLFPLTALLDGGQYSGDVTWDGRGAVPSLSLDEHLSGVDMAKLLAGKPKSVHLSGRGNFSVKATGHGANPDSIVRTLNGRVEAYLTGGAVEGVDLGYQLSRAASLLQRDNAPGVRDTHRTQFDAFKGSAEVVNGVATTKDLLISSPALKVTGEGSTNLTTQAVDLKLLADTLRTTQGVPIQVPVLVTGTTADPLVRPDLEALAKGQLRQKLQDVLGDKLKGLFGKP